MEKERGRGQEKGEGSPRKKDRERGFKNTVNGYGTDEARRGSERGEQRERHGQKMGR